MAIKVVFYSGVFARVGGIEEFTIDLAKVLSNAEVEVRIVCASLQNPALERLKDVGIEVWKSPVYHGCRWNIPDYVLLPLALLAMRDADVVIHQKPFKGWFYKLFPSRPRHLYLTSYSPKEQFGSSELIRRFFSCFDAIITQVNSFGKDLRESGVGQPVHVLPYIPPEASPFMAPRLNGKILRIGMMGRLEQQKNPQYAISIVDELGRLIKSSGIRIEMHFYGTGSLENSTHKYAEELGVSAVFHGGYSRQKVPEITAENDFFLITSITEGQCIVALEVLAGGSPLFATPVGALPEILQDEKRGMLLPEQNAQEAASIISDWLEKHQTLTREQIQLSYLKDYCADEIRHKYVSLIKGLA